MAGTSESARAAAAAEAAAAAAANGLPHVAHVLRMTAGIHGATATTADPSVSPRGAVVPSPAMAACARGPSRDSGSDVASSADGPTVAGLAPSLPPAAPPGPAGPAALTGIECRAVLRAAGNPWRAATAAALAAVESAREHVASIGRAATYALYTTQQGEAVAAGPPTPLSASDALSASLAARVGARPTGDVNTAAPASAAPAAGASQRGRGAAVAQLHALGGGARLPLPRTPQEVYHKERARGQLSLRERVGTGAALEFLVMEAAGEAAMVAAAPPLATSTMSPAPRSSSHDSDSETSGWRSLPRDGTESESSDMDMDPRGTLTTLAAADAMQYSSALRAAGVELGDAIDALSPDARQELVLKFAVLQRRTRRARSMAPAVRIGSRSSSLSSLGPRDDGPLADDDLLEAVEDALRVASLARASAAVAAPHTANQSGIRNRQAPRPPDKRPPSRAPQPIQPQQSFGHATPSFVADARPHSRSASPRDVGTPQRARSFAARPRDVAGAASNVLVQLAQLEEDAADGAAPLAPHAGGVASLGLWDPDVFGMEVDFEEAPKHARRGSLLPPQRGDRRVSIFAPRDKAPPFPPAAHRKASVFTPVGRDRRPSQFALPPIPPGGAASPTRPRTQRI